MHPSLWRVFCPPHLAQFNIDIIPLGWYNIIDEIDDLNTPGVYIVSFWNSDDFGSMIHTIAVKIDENGQLDPHNGELSSEQIFITGYQVYRK